MSNRPNNPPRRGGSRGAAPAVTSNRTMWIIGAVVLVIGIALIAAIVAGRSDDGGGTATAGPGGESKGNAGTVVLNGDVELGTVTTSGTALATYASRGTDPAVGEPAPTLTGENFVGTPVSIGDDGKPKVVMFLAHWCPHCRAEVPRIEEWLDENGMPTDVGLYSVATATDPTRPNYSPSNWLVSEGWTVPVLVDDEAQTAAAAYGLSSYPYFVAIGADGKVVQRGSGELTMSQFEALLEAARTGQAQSLS